MLSSVTNTTACARPEAPHSIKVKSDIKEAESSSNKAQLANLIAIAVWNNAPGGERQTSMLRKPPEAFSHVHQEAVLWPTLRFRSLISTKTNMQKVRCWKAAMEWLAERETGSVNSSLKNSLCFPRSAPMPPSFPVSLRTRQTHTSVTRSHGML